MSALADTISRWNWQFLPPFALAGPESWKALACAAGIAAVVLISLLLIFFVSLVMPRRLTRYGQTINSTALFAVIALAVYTSTLSRSTPFAPVYIAGGILLYLAGTWALGSNYWVVLKKSGGRPAPFFLQLRTFLWMSLVGSSYVFIPPLIFQVASFDRQAGTFFWGSPVLMAGIYGVYLYAVMPKALELLGLRLKDDDLTEGQRGILRRFAEEGEKKDYEIAVARQGLPNALAFLTRKSRRVVIGVDLLDNLEEEEVRGTLYHEEGHLRDRVFVKRLGGLSLLFPALILLYSTYVATDLPGRGLPAFSIFALIFYLVSWLIRRVRLRGELAADAYVKAQGEEVYRSHLSGIEKLYRMGGVDKDICKRRNLAHLDLDERRDLLAEGGTGLPKRTAKRGIWSYIVWAVFGALVAILVINFPLTKDMKWNRAHSKFHDIMYTDDGDRAIAVIRRAVAIAEESFGSGSGKLHTSLNDLTEALSYYDHYEEALHTGARAVEAGKSLYGENHLKFVRSLKNMGEIHYWREEHGTSREWFERALEIQNRLRDDRDDIVDTLEWLSWTWEDEKEYGKAADLQREILALYEGDDEIRYEAADASIQLGTLLGLAGSRGEGDRIHRETLVEVKLTFGEKSETYAEFLLDVAYALCRRGEGERAGQYFAKCLEILDALGETEYLDGESIRQQLAACGGEGQGAAAP